MTPLSERETWIGWVMEAVNEGARVTQVCQFIGLPLRNFYRWQKTEPESCQKEDRGETPIRGVKTDQRPVVIRPKPSHALTMQERAMVLSICNGDEFASLPPSQIVPRLADKGEYLASESTMYRILRQEKQLAHRGRDRAKTVSALKQTHVATKPLQVLAWDVTYLPSAVKGKYFYLHAFEDIFSRYIVGWEVYEAESGENAAEMVHKIGIQYPSIQGECVLHSDRGSPMKSNTLFAKLQEWGIAQSFSRPRVSDDNAHIESFFRTVKYCPRWPDKGFDTLQAARQWVAQFIDFYHHEHRHSGVNFVTPHERFTGQDIEILKKRKTVYEQAKTKNPARWSGDTRNWTYQPIVTLNPCQKEVKTIVEKIKLAA